MDKQRGRQKHFWNKVSKLRASLPALVIESILITFGVLLAFAIDSWKAQKRLERDTDIVLENLRNELISNRGIVLEWLSYHDSLSTRLDKVIENPGVVPIDLIGQALLDELYPEPGISYVLQNTAWQTAHSTQVVRYFKYLTTYNLTYSYVSQEEIEQTKDFLFAKLHESQAPPGYLDRSLLVLKNLLQELSKKEHYLLDTYRDALLEVDRELTSRAG